MLGRQGQEHWREIKGHLLMFFTSEVLNSNASVARSCTSKHSPPHTARPSWNEARSQQEKQMGATAPISNCSKVGESYLGEGPCSGCVLQRPHLTEGTRGTSSGHLLLVRLVTGKDRTSTKEWARMNQVTAEKQHSGVCGKVSRGEAKPDFVTLEELSGLI